jgi:hypothetical protein
MFVGQGGSAGHRDLKCMNLSPYHLMDPHANDGDREKRGEAGAETFPADNQAAVLALEPCKRSLSLTAGDILFEGAPTWFFDFPDPPRNLRPDPRFRRQWRRAFASYPSSVAMTLSHLCGLPRLPVRSRKPSNRGMIWARSSSFAGVVRVANGMPAASVRLWMTMPLPFRPYVTPSPPPLPGEKDASTAAQCH